jgi:hypothetical protein
MQSSIVIARCYPLPVHECIVPGIVSKINDRDSVDMMHTSTLLVPSTSVVDIVGSGMIVGS